MPTARKSPPAPTARRPLALALLAISAAAAALASAVMVPGAAIVGTGTGLVMAVAATWLFADIGHRRDKATLSRLATENAELSRALEAAADRSWELEDNEERYRDLIDARERAEAASLAKSRFLATVSHEFRTPLNGILGLNRLLLEAGLTPAQETYARGVQSSGTALLTLIEDMLDFSKIEAGRLDLRPEPVDIAEIAADVADMLAPKAQRKSIDLGVAVGPGLPARLAIDPVRLRQVLFNLVGNAVKFTDTGGITIRITPEKRGAGPRLRIAFAVEDTGPGIPDDVTDRLFEEFEQADSALSRRHEGAGLGLAISRRLVEAMGGDLNVEARPGGGAAFRFSLDAVVVSEGNPGGPRLDGLRLLAAMPEGSESAIMAEALAAAGPDGRVVDTVNAAAALAGAALAAGMPYDAILLDRRLAPDAGAAMNLLRTVAGDSTPVAMLAEAAGRDDAATFEKAGFAACLIRPVRRSSMLSIVHGIVQAPGPFRIDPGGAPKPAPVMPTVSRAGGTILLAEDNEISALLARAVIESLGHAVIEVRDGHAAIAAAEAGRFDAVFLDLHMPGCDGLQAAARIRAAERGGTRLPIIALTADALPETRRAALAAGIDSLLEKPVSPDALRAALAMALDRRAAA